MSRNRILAVLGASAVVAALVSSASKPASADDSPVTIQPTVQQTLLNHNEASIIPVRHHGHGWGGGRYGGGWGGYGNWGGYYQSPGFGIYIGPRSYGGYYGGYSPYYGGYYYGNPGYYHYHPYGYYYRW